MTFELGVYSFGNRPGTAAGGSGATAQAIRDVLEVVQSVSPPRDAWSAPPGQTR